MSGPVSRHSPAPPRRSVCNACLRPQRSCICQWVQVVPQKVEVLILQHPLEVNQAKGSARLLHVSLPNSRLVVGEQFEPGALADLLTEKYNLLLFPDTADMGSLGLPAPPALNLALLAQPGALRLVVLDGTWRKCRKMLYLNPGLQRLPRLALRDTPASRYLMRKAQGADQLSTLEASCYALMQLEGEQPALTELIGAFDGFVAQQLRYVREHGPHDAQDA